MKSLSKRTTLWLRIWSVARPFNEVEGINDAILGAHIIEITQKQTQHSLMISSKCFETALFIAKRSSC